MKGKKCFRRFSYLCLALLLSCLLNFGVQKNSTALQFTAVPLAPTGNTWPSIGGQVQGTDNLTIDSNRHVRYSRSSTTSLAVRGISFPNAITVDKNNYYTFIVGFQSYKMQDAVIWNITSTDANFDWVSIQKITDSAYFPNINITDTVPSAVDTRFTDYYEIVLKPKRSGTYKPAIYNSDSIFRFTVFNSSTDMLIYVGDLFEYYDSNGQMNQKDDQDRENIEEQSEETEQAGQDAGEEATEKGQTMFAAFSSLVTALGNVRQTNCNLPNFTIYGMEFKDLNMCTYSTPAPIQALGSLLLVFLIVPMGVNCAKRVLGLYNELLGGK